MLSEFIQEGTKGSWLQLIFFCGAICLVPIFYTPTQRYVHIDPLRISRQSSVIYSPYWKWVLVFLLISGIFTLGGQIIITKQGRGILPFYLLVALLAYTVAAFLMVSANFRNVSKIIEFFQWCRQQNVASIRKMDMDRTLKSSDVGMFKGNVFELSKITYREYYYILLKDNKIAGIDKSYLIDPDADRPILKIDESADRSIGHIFNIIAFTAICIAFPIFMLFCNFLTALQPAGNGETHNFMSSISTTFSFLFVVAPEYAATAGTNAVVEKTNSFLQLFHFIYFFFLALPFFRYFGLTAQYALLAQIGGKAGLGLEVDAVAKITGFAVFTLTILIALLALGVSFSNLGLLSGLLAAGLTVALRDTLGNLVAGMQLIWDGSMKKGDVITIPSSSSTDTGSTYGIVEQVRMRYTVVQDRNTVRRLIPNHILTAQEIEHWTHEDNRVRLSIRVNVAVDSDIREVQKILESVCYDVPRVLTEKPPQAMLVDLGDSALVFSVRFWLADAKQGIRPVVSEILINLIERFREEGIVVPFPQREVHFKLPVGAEQPPDRAAGFEIFLEGPAGRQLQA